jgi:hypothetical protein
MGKWDARYKFSGLLAFWKMSVNVAFAEVNTLLLKLSYTFLCTCIKEY